MRTLVILLLLVSSEVLGAQDLDSIALQHIDSLLGLSQNYTSKRNYDHAKVLNLAATGLAVDKFGNGSEAYAKCCFDLALINYYQRKLIDAENKYIEVLLNRERVGDTLNSIFINSLSNLGIVKKESGDLKSAEIHFLRVQRIRELKFGKDHAQYAIGLNNLASLNRDMGDFKKAERLYEHAIEIRKAVLGENHPDYASSLSDLAILYKDMGNVDKSELLFLQSMAIYEYSSGRSHTNFGRILNSLGGLYMQTGQLVKAEQCLLEALAIWEKNLGKGHPMYAGCLNNLSNVYKNMGHYEKSKSLLLESLTLKEKAVGKFHTSYASGLESLGILSWKSGQLNEAVDYLQEALSIYKMNLDKNHPSYARALGNLSVCYEDLKYTSVSDAVLHEWTAINRNRISNAISFLSEQELSDYLKTFEVTGNNLGSYIINRQNNQTNCSALNQIYFDHQLFYKGFLLSASKMLTRLASSSQESEAIYLRIKGYRSQLAEAYVKAERDSQKILYLEELALQSEKELSRSVVGFGDAIKHIKWQDIQSKLTEGEIAIEFVHFKVTFPKESDSILYGALLLQPGNVGPVFINLFNDVKLRNALLGNSERKADFVNNLYACSERGMIQIGNEKLSLYDLIWKPIEAHGLDGVKTIYYTASGMLHRLNPGAIGIDYETILSDRYNLIALNSTRQLVIPNLVSSINNEALLLGGIHFEMETVDTTGDKEAYFATQELSGTWLESGKRGGNWSYLNWTKKEVEHIATSLTKEGVEVVLLTGNEASEDAIKTIGEKRTSPRILHIATHGFFFPDPDAEGRQHTSNSIKSTQVFQTSDNPMIRSGLILSGGNYAWQHGKSVKPDKEDGILTAYEISQMNLSNTELVVLSACETGLGDIQGNEGVYGLQRAFKIAGAKYLIMSLWQVPDRETMEFMTTFYRNWLEGKLPIPDAFRKTQREMRDRFFNPYSWAGFVLLE